MKKSAFIFASAIVAAIMCMFTGCSDDQEEDNGLPFSAPNEKFINNLLSTKTPTTIRSTRRCRHFLLNMDNKWEEMNYALVLYTETGVGPETITFMDGKVQVPILTLWGYSWKSSFLDKSYQDVHLLAYVWREYTERTQQQQNIYVISDVRYDKKTHLISFDNTDFEAFSCENNEFLISSCDNPYSRKAEYYDTADAVVADESADLIFNSCQDAFIFIIDSMRKDFGNTIKLSDFISSENSRILDLNDIEMTVRGM